MGVPAFFRWLSKKYPSIVVHCVEEKPKELNGVSAPPDTSQPNPNSVEFDNLYLDMNGIIHPCCHPENKPAPKNEDEMMVDIFEYIDRIFSIVRPRKVLYMAIDGVAPRAKMNQQRSRRFRSAKEAREKAEDIDRIKSGLLQQGAILPPDSSKAEHFDSNCITPGTSFMDRLSKCLQFYIADRLSNDPGWANLKVVLSDANVPGEGEHKIMDYIRKQRGQPGYDPNTHHCLNGADADLIMLGLATHDPYFTILREEFKPNQKRTCDVCGQVGHDREDCVGLPKEKQGEFDELSKPMAQEQEFIFIRLNVLREYLGRELKMEGLPFGYCFERALDDWVFMCFFVGNDFLPHLPSLEIREGAIDRLIRLYKNNIVQAGGYLTDSGFVQLDRVELILKELGKAEDEILKSRYENEMRYQNRLKQNKARGRYSQGNEGTPLRVFGITPLGKRKAEPNQTEVANKIAATDLRKMLTNRTPDSVMTPPTTPGSGSPQPGKSATDEDDDKPQDDIRLHEEGWKQRYYAKKFNDGVVMDQPEYDTFCKSIACEYVRGLSWVLQYYYQGCPSWDWYFPYHYAPFASDFCSITSVDIMFEKSTRPFNPLEQLMAVFPAASGCFLPPTWRDLMSNPESPIIDFYPEDFRIDLNGKKFAWQGVALLPFVDEKRLLAELQNVYGDLTEDEKRRNHRNIDFLFVGPKPTLRDYLAGLYEGNSLAEKQELLPGTSDGFFGSVIGCDEPALPMRSIAAPVPGLKPVSVNLSVSVRYSDPSYPEGHIFKARLLEGLKPPPCVLKPTNYPGSSPYRPQVGFSPNSRSPYSSSPGARRMVGHHLQDRNSPSTPTGRQEYYQQSNRMDSQSNYNQRGQMAGAAHNQRGYNQQGYNQQGYNQQANPRQQGYNQQGYGGGGGYGNARGNSGQYHDQRHSTPQGHHMNERGRDNREPRDPRRHSYPLDQHRYHPY